MVVIGAWNRRSDHRDGASRPHRHWNWYAGRCVLRHLLQLPRPLVHRDIKLQNVLSVPGAPLSDLTPD